MPDLETSMAATSSGDKELGIAPCLLNIAESHTVATLGSACARALGQTTGSKIVGIYLLDRPTPNLVYSNEVPSGFLDDYRAGLAQNDPLVDSILSDGKVLDGPSYFGSAQWKKTVTYDLLHTWGLRSNMCGPLLYDGKTVGIFYTASRTEASPYRAAEKHWMAMFCRAASLALRPFLLENSRPMRADLPERAAMVARMICLGLTNKEIARQMGISHHTVKEHTSNLCKKFRSTNRTTLAVALQYPDGPEGKTAAALASPSPGRPHRA
jgi:DNA-binding CsgD family transcriptional regulator